MSNKYIRDMTEKISYIPARLRSAAKGGFVTGANDVVDDVFGKSQQDINADTYRKDETYSKEQLDNMITTPEQEYKSVVATSSTATLADIAALIATKYPDDKEKADTIYRVGNWDGTQYNTGAYSEYTWDGTQYVFMSKKEPGIDDEPIPESENLAKSGGISLSLSLKADSEDVQELTKVTKKQIAPLATSTVVINPDSNGKMEVAIPAKSYYTVIVKDPQNSISSIDALYVIYRGSSTRTAIGLDLSANEEYRFYTLNPIDYLCVYVARTNMSPDTSIVKLCAYEEDNAVNKMEQHEYDIQSIGDDIKHFRIRRELPGTSGVEEKVLVNKKVGEILKAGIVDRGNNVTQCALYALYKGEGSHTMLALLNSANSFSYSNTLTKEIERVDFYISSDWVSGDIDVDFVIESALQEEVSKCADGIATLNNIIHPYWEALLSSDGSSYINPDTNGKLPVDIKEGDEFKIKVINEDGNITGANAFYVIYKGTSERVNLGISGILPNTEYKFTAMRDIDYICTYIYTDHITGACSMVFRVDGYGLADEASGGGTDFSNQRYYEIFKQVANDAMMRFIPYSVTVPTVNKMHQVDADFMESCNIVFFTDSHTDYRPLAESVQNAKDVVSFVNSAKRKMVLISRNIDKNLFDAVVHGGDVTTSGYKVTSEHDAALAAPFFEITKELSVPFVFTPGNHDTLIKDTAWASMYGDWAEETFGLVRQTKSNNVKSSWSYYDIEDKKIRVIAVDVTDVDLSVMGTDGYPLYNGSNSWYISQEQMDWLVGTALNFDDKDDSDWGVVCVMHQSVQISYNNTWYPGTRLSPAIPSAIEKFFEVCKAFNSQGTYSSSYSYPTDSFYNLTIDADFTRYSAKKWDSHEWVQESGVSKDATFTCCRKAEEGLVINFVVGNVTEYYIYVKYADDDTNTFIGIYSPNAEVNVPITKDVEQVYVLVKNTDITGNVSGSFKILQRKPHIVCWLNGHEHRDYNIVKDGINIIWTAQGSAMTAYSDFKVPRVLGTPTQNLFDIISIDTLRRKIRMVRVGAGANCFGEKYPWGDRFLPDGLSY